MTVPSPDVPPSGQPGPGPGPQGQPGPPPPPPGGYGPGYGPYPGPYGYPGYYPPPQLGTNTMAILAIVFAFVFCPLGIVFGCIALKQLKRNPQEGRGLAIAGIAVGAACTALTVAYVIFIAVFFSTLVHDIPDPNSTSSSMRALLGF